MSDSEAAALSEPPVKTSDELEGAEREHDAAAQEEDQAPGTGPKDRGTAPVALKDITLGEPESGDRDE
jgi:hypothetical protein